MLRVMAISLIIFLVGCSSVMNNSIVEKNNTTSEQLKKTNIFYYYVNPDNEYQAMDVVKGRFAWQDGCLYLIGPDGTYNTAMFPQYPKGIVKWDQTTKTLNLNGKVFKMGDYINTNGMYQPYDPDGINHKIYATQGDKRCLNHMLAYIGTVNINRN